MEAFSRLLFKAIHEVSDLRINLSKSELISVGEVERLLVLVAVLGCKVANLPVTYLGLPLGASFKAKGVWDGVVERVQRHLAGWKRQYLSKGGRNFRGIFCEEVDERISDITWLIEGRFVAQRSIAKDREATVTSYLGGGEVVVWDIQLRGEDVLVWNVAGAKGRFSVRFFYRSLVGKVGCVFPWRSIWVPCVSSKVVFLWTVALGSCGHVVELAGGLVFSGVGNGCGCCCCNSGHFLYYYRLALKYFRPLIWHMSLVKLTITITPDKKWQFRNFQ
ncbi:hypothetical protein CsSME_00021626 [Camellia sinensis var. sinensis]